MTELVRTPSDDESHRLVLVTGPSGAGRSTAINVLEDLGYEVIDNLPLTLMPRLFSGPPLARPPPAPRRPSSPLCILIYILIF